LPGSAGFCGRQNSVETGRPSASRARVVRPRPMISGMRPPARTSSRITGVFSCDSAITAPFFSAVTFEVAASICSSISSPMSIWPQSISTGSAPASSMVLKKIGAIFEPRQTPPKRLFGT
jgi:hypothetical protein